MKCLHPRRPAGIALIIVMVVILVLAALAGGFAYSMKVETTLARNASYDHDLEWLGRSGVELARYVLAQQLEPCDALNQKWAGGPGVSPKRTARWRESRSRMSSWARVGSRSRSWIRNAK